MIINDLDGYYIVFDTKNWNTELDTLIVNLRWRSDTGEEEGPKGGTHIYTVWQAIGYAAK